MTRTVVDIIAEASKGMRLPVSCSPDLPEQDKRIIDTWLASQRTQDQPEANNWLQLLFESKPLFRNLTYDALRGKWVDFINYCGTCLDLTRLDEYTSVFPILRDTGIRGLLRSLDSMKSELFESFVPILLIKGRAPAVYRINTKGDDHISISQAMAEDVVNIAVLEWEQSRPKKIQARERLCDLMSMCLAKA